jgi:exosortase
MPQDFSKPKLALPWLIEIILIGAFWSVNIWQLQFEWSVNEQYSYGFFVPFLALYLAYLRQANAPILSPSKNTLTPIFLALAFIGTYCTMWMFPANGDWRVLHMAQWGWSAMATFAILYHRGGLKFAWHFLFPIFFMAIAVPWPRFLEKALINGLMQHVAQATVEVFNFCGYYAHQQANAIVLPTGTVNVAEACSGVRSFQSTLMGGLFLGEMFALTFWSRFLLVGLSCMLAFLLNIARTFLLAYIASQQGLQNVKAWHDPAGYSIFFISFGVLFLLAIGLSQRTNMPVKILPEKIVPGGSGLKIWDGGILAIIWMGCVPLSYAWYYWRSEPQNYQPLWNMNWQLIEPEVAVAPLDHTLQSILFTDLGLTVQWAEDVVGRWLIYFMKWVTPEGSQISGLHYPGNCLTSLGWHLVQTYEPFEWKRNGVTLTVVPMAFSMRNELVYVFDIQWDPSGYPYHQTQGLRIYRDRFIDVWEGNRKGQKHVLECIAYDFPSIESAKSSFKAFMDKAFEVLQ